MSNNTVPGPDWDKEIQDLVDSVEADQVADDADRMGHAGVPVDGVDGPGETMSAPVLDADLAELLAERTGDLQRLQAEYVNYKRRVDRDRDLARQRGIEAVVADLLPVLDGIDAARTHGELTEGAAMIASELEKVAAKYGLTAFGQSGDPFDPHIHEALLQIDRPGYPVTSVAEVYQRGYKLGDFVLRPARVGVADADPACEVPTDGSTLGMDAVPSGMAASAQGAAASGQGADGGASDPDSPSAGDTSAGDTQASVPGDPSDPDSPSASSSDQQ